MTTDTDGVDRLDDDDDNDSVLTASEEPSTGICNLLSGCSPDGDAANDDTDGDGS